MKLGVYSIVLPDYHREEAAAKVAEIGYTGIEWTVGYPDRVFDSGQQWHVSLEDLEEDAPRAREAAERYGLEIPSLGTSADTGDFEKIQRLMRGAVAMGAPMLRIGSAGYDGSTHYDELRETVIENYRTIEQMAADHGVKALIEIHSNTICPSASATMRILEHFDPEHVGAILDPGNMVIEGMESWRMAVEILGPYLAHVHAKNMSWVRDDEGEWTWENASLEDGIADFEAIIAALAEYDYQGYIDLEDFRGGYCVRPEGITTEQKLQEAYDYLSRLLEEAEG
ncbi:MAG: sugar phosphate isomerase/epimerase family protein [Armatimonadota bacterium]|nr:sugar phosphate isomerase/epimerase family protein [Armatimonadota bacterium]